MSASPLSRWWRGRTPPWKTGRCAAACSAAASQKHAAQEIGTLSGGEQAKVKLCLLSLTPCNFLMLDEPTNHLDAQAKAALQKALAEFPGAVLLVSHEEAFYRDWAEKIIPVGGGRAAERRGGLS